MSLLKMFRRKPPTFEIALIGNVWLSRPLTHDGVTGELGVRQLPPDFRHEPFKFVCLAQSVHAMTPQEQAALTHKIQTALEKDCFSLLVLVHQIPGRITWYAYSATEAALDGAFASLGDPSIPWGINEDDAWLEYENAKRLVGA